MRLPTFLPAWPTVPTPSEQNSPVREDESMPKGAGQLLAGVA